jgi:hypothetical protein
VNRNRPSTSLDTIMRSAEASRDDVQTRDPEAPALRERSWLTRRLRLGLAIGIAVVVVLAMVAVVGPSSVVRQFQLSFTRQPASFSALSVSEQELPRLMRAGEPNTVAFELLNHEHRNVRYSYTIGLLGKGRTVASRSGEVELESGQSILVADRIVPPAPNTKYIVSIQLTGRSERLHYSTRTES